MSGLGLWEVGDSLIYKGCAVMTVVSVAGPWLTCSSGGRIYALSGRQTRHDCRINI